MKNKALKICLLRPFALIVLSTLFCSIVNGQNKPRISQFDVVVYGATSGGITAAIEASRLGKSVLLIEPSNRIGGLTTGGLGRTDIGKEHAIGGISREFYQNIWKYYTDSTNWKWQLRKNYFKGDNRDLQGDLAIMWTFEPSAALKVYKDMISAEKKITLVYLERLNRTSGVKIQDTKILEITMESGKVYRGKIFIDATYEGDLMAAAGVSYTVGREANKQYGESLNGVQANRVNLTLQGRPSANAWYHNFVDGVDPYIIKGDKTSGVLPLISTDPPGIDGSADKRIQAYCFRMTLTDHPDNRIPFEKPKNYNELVYELLFRNYEAAPGGDITKMYNYGVIVPWIISMMPNRKTDINNQKGFSTNFIGKNYTYPDASYEERKKIVEEHRNYQKGLMWTLANHPRIPEPVRKEVSRWGICKDEYEEEDGWQNQLYIREARRMISDYVMTQRNCEAIDMVNDPVGLGAYGIDSHNTQRYIDANGFVQNEGNVAASVDNPYPISYRSIVPKKSECSNLLVPICLSATHVAYGSIRMEPVFMVLGQSAGAAASIAIDRGQKLQDINYDELRETLVKGKQRLIVQPK